MEPTLKFRWLALSGVKDIDDHPSRIESGTISCKYFVLQQWFDNNSFFPCGEWRDIPVERE